MINSGLRVLIVEDEALESEAQKRIIEDYAEGFTVIGTATNGFDALHIINNEYLDIVLLDIRLPGIDGLSIGRKIVQRLPRCKIIISTAYDEFEYAHSALDIKPIAYLLKPIRPEDLLQALQDAADEINQDKAAELERQKLRARLQSSIPLLRQAFVHNVVHGWLDDDEIKAQASFLKVELPDTVCCFNIDTFATIASGEDEESLQFLKLKVQRIIEESCGGGCCLGVVDNTNLALLFSAKRRFKESAASTSLLLMNKILDRVSHECGISMTAGLGPIVSRPSDLYLSYTLAARAERLKVLTGGGRVISHCEVPEGLDVSLRVSGKDEKRLVNMLLTGDEEGVFELINRYANNTVDNAIELLLILSRCMVAAGGDSRSITDIQNRTLFRILNTKPQQLNDVLKKTIEDICLTYTMDKCNEEIVHSVIKYIEENCLSDISLSGVAQTYHISPPHLCRLIKGHTGKTFTEYIAELRLNRAKALLSSTDLPLKEVARNVGYSNPNYFSTVFKKLTGETPTDFRNRARCWLGRWQCADRSC